MSAIFTPFVFQSAVQAITPILLASLAGVLCGRVGVFNLALEGQMLVGAFAAIVGSYFTHSALGGVAAAMAGAVAFSLVLAYGATVFRGDPVVTSIGMNLLASGLTAYLLRGTFGVSGTFSDPGIVGLGRIAIPPLIGVPVLGWAFGRQSALTWVAWALTAAVSVVLFKTPVGLRLRGVGEQPDAAETLDVDIVRYRVVTVLVAGALTGLAGAQLSLGAVSVFAEEIGAQVRRHVVHDPLEAKLLEGATKPIRELTIGVKIERLAGDRGAFHDLAFNGEHGAGARFFLAFAQPVDAAKVSRDTRKHVTELT
jgi:general nucleoside transport system permease protein